MTRILVVDDDQDYLWIILRKLKPFFDVEGVSTLTEAIKAFATNGFRAVMLDLGLPDSDSAKTVARMKVQYPHCAIVVLSGYEDPKRIKQCISDSASSYLIKGRDDLNPAIMAAAINSAIASNESCHKADQAQKQIENGFGI